MFARTSVAASALAALALGGCGSKEGAGSAGQQPKGEVIARVGKAVITTEEFKSRLDQQSPFIRARYNTLERKKEFLDTMIRFELLAQEAEKAGLTNDPEFQSTMKKYLVQKITRKKYDEAEQSEQIPDEELKKYYDEHLDEYVKAERFRASHIFFKGETPAEKADAKKKANKFFADIKAKEKAGDRGAFNAIAREHSDDARTKALGGDLRYLSKQDLTNTETAELAEAVFALKETNDTVVVETPKGVHVARLTGKQAAIDRKFEEVKDQIKMRLARERRAKGFEDFVAQLRQSAKITIDDKALDAIPVDAAPSSPSSPFGSPPAAMGGGSTTPIQVMPAGTAPPAPAAPPAGNP